MINSDSLAKVVRPAFGAVGLIVYLTALTLGSIYFLFQVPRFDYWDVVYQSSFVWGQSQSHPFHLVSYLFEPVVDSFMVLPRLLIFVSNHVGGRYVFLLELALTLFAFFSGYVLLLKILGLPAVLKNSTKSIDVIRLGVVTLIYWWPANLPTYANTWYSIQYCSVIVTGFLAIYFATRADTGAIKQLLTYLCWLLSAISHGTGLLLGPALVVYLIVNEKRRSWLASSILATSCVLLVTLQVIGYGPSEATADSNLLSLSTLKFFTHIVTPTRWQTVTFLLVVCPFLYLAVLRIMGSWRGFLGSAFGIIILWCCAVWVGTFIARVNFHNLSPHYLRFFSLMYIAWVLLSIDFLFVDRRALTRKIAFFALAGMALIWIKGIETGISQARKYTEQNIAGYRALLSDDRATGNTISLLYPDEHRLRTVLVPRLVNYEPYPYKLLLRTEVSN